MPDYGKNRVEPIDVAEQFPHDIPILLVASETDKSVPFECTENLCTALRNANHPHLYFLTLKNGHHHSQLINDKEDATILEAVTHAFWLRCGITHIAELANKGEIPLNACRITKQSA